MVYNYLLMKTLLFALFIVVSSFSTLANSVSPYIVVEKTGTNLFSRINSDQEKLEKFPELMRDIVEQELMPAIDHKYVAYKILGKHLKKTTKEQRAQFATAMQAYLVRTYASALSQYKNQHVNYEPEKPTKNAKIVAVDTVITESGKPDITITFKLRKNKKADAWQVFDMVVEGVSMVQSKQAEIQSRIKKHGIEQVTLELAALRK